MGDVADVQMSHNIHVGSSQVEQERASTLIEFVCLAKHSRDTLNAQGFSVTSHRRLPAYCARGAEQNHEWTRVPPSRLCDLTIGLMEDRPPYPMASGERQRPD